VSNCGHLEGVDVENGIAGPAPDADGCVDCLSMGGRWLHLRRCLECGHIGCCDSSPNRHASAHARSAGHPLVQSFEPAEEWIWCYADETTLELELPPSPSHP
jgi:hypothetical protein